MAQSMTMFSSLRTRMRFGLLPLLALTLTALEMHADIDITAMERLPTKTGAGTSSRTKVEGDDRCDDDAPPAEYPPDLSREPWVGKWTPNKDVLRSKHNQNRKMGRCNHEFNVCVHVDRSGAVSHWASAFAAPDVAAVEILGKAHVPSSNCTVIPR